MRIRWQQKVTNKRVVELAEINDMSCEVPRRRWNWLGHILRREGENDCFTALGCSPEGRRAKYWEKNGRERAKQSRVKELGSSQSDCTRQGVLVRQHGGLMCLLA